MDVDTSRKNSYQLNDRRFFLSEKPFLIYSQQISLLKTKNVLIPDENLAKEVLGSISYYNIVNGYKDIFETYFDKVDKIEKFRNKITLEKLHAVYLIDKDFNNLLFKYIIYIENSLKTKLSYNIAMSIGETQSEYCDYQKYIENRPLDRKVVIERVNKEILNSSNKPVKHYLDNHTHIPPWIAVKALYLGTTINWYKVLPPNIKANIANSFFIDDVLEIEEKKELLLVILNLLHEYRNDIAHGSRTFLSNVSGELTKTLLLKSVTPQTLTEDEFSLGIGKKDLFAVLLSIGLLINDRLVFKHFLYDLNLIFYHYNDEEILSSKGSFYDTLNIPENCLDRLTNIYNIKFT